MTPAHIAWVLAGRPSGTPLIASSGAVLDYGRNVGAALRRAIAEAFRVEDVVFFANTTNQRRTLEPIANASGCAVDIVSYGRMRWSPMCEAMVAARESSAASRPDRLSAARALARAQELIRQTGARTLVVASQHDLAARALVAVGLSNGLTTVYVPHAPAADVPHYRDLPFHRALLRGPAEVSFYGELGAAPGGMVAVGAPGVPEAEPPIALDPSGPVLVGLSPWPKEILDSFIELVDDAEIGDVVVGLHPRMSLSAMAGRLPSSWRVLGGDRTVEHLEGDFPVVVQRDSGLSLEAMLRGIPVIQVRLPGDSACALPLLRDTDVPVASTPEELSAITASLRASTNVLRGRFQSLAGQWASSCGPTSAAIAWTVISSLDLATAKAPLVLDAHAWTP